MFDASVILYPLLIVLGAVLDLLYFAIVIYFVLDILYVFQILNYSHRRILLVYRWLGTLLDPILDILRRYIPPFKSIDTASLVLLLALLFFRAMIVRMLAVF